VRSSRRIVLVVVAAVALAVLAGGGWFAYDAQQARASLQQVASNAQVLQRELLAGNTAQAKSALAAMQDSAADAQSHTDGPMWAMAGELPGAGANVEAVQTVAAVARDLSDEALPPVVDASDALDLGTFSPRDGRIDLEVLERLVPVVDQASKGFAVAEADLAAVDTDSLMASVQTPVLDLADKVGEAARLTATTDTALQLLPGMLGGDGPRDYLTLFQNNAEIRSTGGMPGALAILRTNEGRVSLASQATPSDVGTFARPVLPLTEGEVALYETKLATFFADVNFTPDFPRTAELASAMWQERIGQRVDGVLSIDPVALSYLLEATGPVTLRDGATLTSSNAVDVLLNQVYVDIPDPVEQNEYFADAASRVFDAVASGAGSPRLLVDGLARGVAEGRIYAWSTDEQEQATLSDTAMGGELIPADGKTPYVGFYLNDATGAKMQYYLDYDAVVEATGCATDGTQTFDATFTMTSNAPADGADLPVSIIGPGFGAPPGTMLMNLRVYAPAGGTFGTMTVGKQKLRFDTLAHDDHVVARLAILLTPGETQRLKVELTSGPDQTGAPRVDITPGVRPGAEAQVSGSAC
jgi:hypothetical protein